MHKTEEIRVYAALTEILSIVRNVRGKKTAPSELDRVHERLVELAEDALINRGKE